MDLIWLPGSLPGELKSHPDKTLRDHLSEVADLAVSLADHQGCPLDREMIRRVALTHDLGKARPAFQKYLSGQGQRVDHSFPSALFTLHLTKDLWAAEAVRRHHGSLVEFEETVKFWATRLSYEQIRKIMREVDPSWPQIMSEREWRVKTGEWLLNLPVSHCTWLALRLFISILAVADRLNALGVETLNHQKVPSFRLPVYRDRSVIDRWRSTLRKQVLANVEQTEGPGVYSLTLPTGAGKTALGLEIAQKWVGRWGMKNIVYSLPFISVVEQNAAVAGNLFGTDWVQEDHSQVDTVTEQDQGAGPLQKMIWLFRFWKDPVVVTTLTKLWSVLFKPRANAAINFYRLANSVVILDEPQGISPRLWNGLGKMLDYLSREMNVCFLLMTATQPLVPVWRDLAPFEHDVPVNRHVFHYIPGRHNLEELPDLISEQCDLDRGSGLLVFNTRKSALKSYRLFRERFPDMKPLLFLSRWMTPHHRRRVTRYLRFLERKDRPRFLISTQVVEAGMDLDFTWVFRDLGPLDSIVQVAGRCNRHFRREEEGQVLVTELADQRRGYAEYVYHPVLLEQTKRILSEQNTFREGDVTALVDRYYRKIREGLVPEPLWEALGNGQWTAVPPPTEEQYFEQDMVFVEEHPRVRADLEQLIHTTWTLDRRDEQKRLKRRLGNHLVEVSHPLLTDWQTHSGGLFIGDSVPTLEEYPGGRTWLITRRGIGSIYHPVTGFVPCQVEEEEEER